METQEQRMYFQRAIAQLDEIILLLRKIYEDEENDEHDEQQKIRVGRKDY